MGGGVAKISKIIWLELHWDMTPLCHRLPKKKPVVWVCQKDYQLTMLRSPPPVIPEWVLLWMMCRCMSLLQSVPCGTTVMLILHYEHIRPRFEVLIELFWEQQFPRPSQHLKTSH